MAGKAGEVAGQPAFASLNHGRPPSPEKTKNLKAPFIHGFIVDEWETTNSCLTGKRSRAPTHGTEELCHGWAPAAEVEEEGAKT